MRAISRTPESQDLDAFIERQSAKNTVAMTPPTEAQIREAFVGKPGPMGGPNPHRAQLLNDAIERIEAEEAARQIIALRKTRT
jgi:hypothetical protein